MPELLNPALDVVPCNLQADEVNQLVKDYLGGVEIVNLGESFTSKTYPGQFVPYEIKLSDGSIKKFNLAIRKDNPAGRWQVDGGI